jgi:hypothetical protein
MWWRCFSCKCSTSRIRSVFSLRVLISSSSWVILTVLKVAMAMAMAAMEIPMVIKCFGHPGVEISVFCGRALMMSRNSSSDPSMMERLTSVTDFVIDLNG